MDTETCAHIVKSKEGPRRCKKLPRPLSEYCGLHDPSKEKTKTPVKKPTVTKSKNFFDDDSSSSDCEDEESVEIDAKETVKENEFFNKLIIDPDAILEPELEITSKMIKWTLYRNHDLVFSLFSDKISKKDLYDFLDTSRVDLSRHPDLPYEGKKYYIGKNWKNVSLYRDVNEDLQELVIRKSKHGIAFIDNPSEKVSELHKKLYMTVTD